MMYGIGWTYIVIAETVNAKFGLGHLINVATSRGRTDQVFVVLIIIILFSYLFDTLCSYIIERIFKWKYTGREVK
jgi:ABC-type nitrate/sulfonate/bicarbonate transport system permease component